ncbi:hypothetical protein NicSoilB4_04190 [Arthrobacter sp. NicSoilB4]|nr:hypothetical protein NicSoilB4_04190 [Arthrobacter sp. NicSoilB4]
MRGRQQVYPTIECAPNRAPWARIFQWDMPLPGGWECAWLDYVHRLRRGRGMSRGAGVRGANWAMPGSSGSLVSAFDSEATGEFA